jgi:hypothetical protein
MFARALNGGILARGGSAHHNSSLRVSEQRRDTRGQQGVLRIKPRRPRRTFNVGAALNMFVRTELLDRGVDLRAVGQTVPPVEIDLSVMNHDLPSDQAPAEVIMENDRRRGALPASGIVRRPECDILRRARVRSPRLAKSGQYGCHLHVVDCKREV